MYTIQQSHGNSDWRYMPDSQFMRYNELPTRIRAEENAQWLKDNNHDGTFYRVVETITDTEIQGFIEWLLDDDSDDTNDTNHFEIIASSDDLKITKLINNEAKDYFGQAITLDQFIMIQERVAELQKCT